MKGFDNVMFYHQFVSISQQIFALHPQWNEPVFKNGAFLPKNLSFEKTVTCMEIGS